MYLRCFVFDNPRDWSKLLPWTEFWYNTSYHHSTEMTPFKAVYGRDPPSIIKYAINKQDHPDMQNLLLQRDQTLAQLKIHPQGRRNTQFEAQNKEFQAGRLCVGIILVFRERRERMEGDNFLTILLISLVKYFYSTG